MTVKLFAQAALLALVLGGATSPGLAAEGLQAIRDRGRILVAVDLSHPPYGMLDAKAEQVGSDIDTAKLLAQDLGVKLEVVPVSGANRVPFLLSGKVDVVIASFSITEERKKVVDYSKPYGVIPVVVAAPESVKIAAASDLSGHTVAVARGTTADIELTRTVKGVEGVDIVRYEDEATTNTAVGTGQQDVFAAALSTANSVRDSNPDKHLQVKITMAAYPMAVGLRKKDPALLDWMDRWVATNLQNGKLNGIYKAYFGESLPADMLK